MYRKRKVPVEPIIHIYSMADSEKASATALVRCLVKFVKGACTNDVSREGEGGGYPNSDGRRGRLRDLYSKNSDKGGRGSKIPKI